MHRFQGVGTYATVGLDFALAVVIGFAAGYWGDKHFGTRPWLMIAGFMFGVAAGFNLLWKAAQRMRLETEREDRQARSSISQDRDDGDGNHDER